METAKKPRKPAVRFNAELKKQFIQHYANGATVTEAAAEIGVSRGTIYYAEQKDASFAAALEGARAAHLENFRDALLTQIRQDGSWQARAWIAERMFPEDFAKPAPRNFAGAQQPIFNVTTETIYPQK